jgi:hypothetical protein
MAVHSIYLPFSREQLREHFVPNDQATEEHIAYYEASAKRYEQFVKQFPDRTGRSLGELRLPCQIEKDERFWLTATLLTLYHRTDRDSLFSNLLERSFHGSKPDIPSFRNWQDALAGRLHLFFEVGMSSPKTYRSWLSNNIARRQPIPYIRHAAQRQPGVFRENLEGFTKLDALLLNETNGFSVLFEAKVLSDVSCTVAYDPTRNQIARNIDVMLEKPSAVGLMLAKRDPRLSLFVLLTPRLFQTRWQSRLYGWLMQDYRRNETALARDLPHRSDEELSGVSRRIGWLSWEDCQEICPQACQWLRE